MSRANAQPDRISCHSEPIELPCGDFLAVDVSCEWQVDRYQYSVGVLFRNERIELFRSVERNPDQVWPSSPPIQQVQRQLVEGNPALLGVGMSGGSFWSATFLVDCTKKERPVWAKKKSPGGSRLGISAEFACKVHQAPADSCRSWESLRSSFPIEILHRKAIRFRVTQLENRFKDGVSVALTGLHECGLKWQSATVEITPAKANAAQVRWGWELSVGSRSSAHEYS